MYHRETLQRCVYREFSGNEEIFRMLREVERIHLPRILAVREEAGNVAVLEEYIIGDTLEFLLRGGPLTLEQTCNVALQLCEALKILRRASWVVRRLPHWLIPTSFMIPVPRHDLHMRFYGFLPGGYKIIYKKRRISLWV